LAVDLHPRMMFLVRQRLEGRANETRELPDGPGFRRALHTAERFPIRMHQSDLTAIISRGFQDRNLLEDPDVQEAIAQTIELLDRGALRVAEKEADGWKVNAWVKEAILLYFASRPLEPIEAGALRFYDKIPTKTNLEEQGIRVVPPGVARYGSFLEPVILWLQKPQSIRSLANVSA
jgi:hypothetical protein